MADIKGTPKTLKEAIQNGLGDAEVDQIMAVRIELHVLDFLAQRFAVAYMECEDESVGDGEARRMLMRLQRLYLSVITREVKE